MLLGNRPDATNCGCVRGGGPEKMVEDNSGVGKVSMSQALGFRPLLLLPVFCAAISQAACSQDSLSIRTLEPGKRIERQIAPGEVHAYELKLQRGQLLRFKVMVRGTPAIDVLQPDGSKTLEAWAYNYDEEYSLEVVAKASGIYRLQMATDSYTPGRYELTVEELLTAAQASARIALQKARLAAAERWVAANSIPLETVEAGHGFRDLEPLKKLVGNARIVALGEATHGTREFFQLKHRMLEFLVSEMGFTVFGMEAPMPEGFDVNHYVLTGEGDPAKALSGLHFWIWDTEEVLDLIRWMRRYNADPRHKRKVKFYGFDMSFPGRAAKVTLVYLRKVDSEGAAVAEPALAVLSNPIASAENEPTILSKELTEQLTTYTKELLARFDERKQDYIRRSSPSEWALARQHARILAQWTDNIKHGGTGSRRDHYMAENIAWILEQEGRDAKIAVWAHNSHVATASSRMGGDLRKMFGNRLVVFGLTFNQGAFQALSEKNGDIRGFEVGPAPVGSLDATLAAAGLPIVALPLRRLPRAGPVAEWFNTEEVTHDIGYYDEQIEAWNFATLSVSRVYDALLFIERTSAARAMPSGQRPLYPKLATPANLDFESGQPGDVPADWIARPPLVSDLSGADMPAYFGFHVATSEEGPRSGKRCAEISRLPGKHYGEAAGWLQQRIDAAPYRGKRIRLRAAVRAEVIGPGNQAHLWLRVSRKDFTPLFFDAMLDRPITSSEWRDYEIVGEVSEDAETIEYGLALVGDGRAWLDTVSIGTAQTAPRTIR